MMMKKLKRIRLINWHYFVNETIDVGGSFLVSGENTSGKSTVLDAIQLVLTTNKRRFNTAANEKSNRNLMGYVRCKTGNENNAYLRKGNVVSYVALEFYEEKTGKTFVIGAKMDSSDEEASVKTKWFVVEDGLDSIAFLSGNRPSMTDEFKHRGKKIQLILRDHEARDRFARRMGNLDSRFFDIIPKSLAFKPMDNVKDFINKFILAERNIEVASLKRNIESLKELEDLMELTREKIKDLEGIQAINSEIEDRNNKIKINRILISKAKVEQAEFRMEGLRKEALVLEQKIKESMQKAKGYEDNLDTGRERLTSYRIALEKNENSAIIQKVLGRLKDLENDERNAIKDYNALKSGLNTVANIALKLKKYDDYFVSKEELSNLAVENMATEDKALLIHEIDKALKVRDEKYSELLHKGKTNLELFKNEKDDLDKEVGRLKNKRITYPSNTIKLKKAIENAFAKRGIARSVHVFCELIEITDARWQDAVEGYLNTQRFNIIVEPKDYDMALEVYKRIRDEVHTVGLVNTGKLNMDIKMNKSSLFEVVKCENRYAKAYAALLLNRVVCCNDIHELKEHRVAITDNCMLYKNFAVRKINSEIYRVPYIGARAIDVQLKMKQNRLAEIDEVLPKLKDEIDRLESVVKVIRLFRKDDLLNFIQSPAQLSTIRKSIAGERENLKDAENDPNYIELKMGMEKKEKEIVELDKRYKEELKLSADFGAKDNQLQNNIIETLKFKRSLEAELEDVLNQNGSLAKAGIEKYNEQIKIKDIDSIINNFGRRISALETEIRERGVALLNRQHVFCQKYESDLNTGAEYMEEYNEEHYKLVSSEIIKFDEDLKKAKENCHLEFRESFLARLKEYIENAQFEFKHLNKALKDVYYGEDSYRFEIKHNKKKESIYKMIMSENNIMEDFNLWSNAFDKEFEDEMDDLFSKLTAYDDQGENVLSEYTDYRCYLDYDIIVENRNGQSQRFSKIYGEKSGGETQTPFYVAIAASFAQLYKLEDTVRIIMFDEAFDKMDDNRIASMVDFLNRQEFQIILATPPSKLEVIGEKMDTILMAMRDGSTSIIESYDL